jgi:hypothetical protein
MVVVLKLLIVTIRKSSNPAMFLMARTDAGKTAAMRLVELSDPARRDIREIIEEALRRTGSLRGAAGEMDLPATTVSRWIRDLGGRVVTETHVEFEE